MSDNDISNRIERIKERLTSVSNGTWMSPPRTNVLGRGIVSIPTGQVIAIGVSKDADAEFLTHSARDISFLLEQLATVTHETTATKAALAASEARLREVERCAKPLIDAYDEIPEGLRSTLRIWNPDMPDSTMHLSASTDHLKALKQAAAVVRKGVAGGE